MKKILIFTTAIICATSVIAQHDEVYCNSNTPGWGRSLGTVSFASDKTWKIGEQTWSDAVTATACQKEIFDGGVLEPFFNFNADCRSNPKYPGDLFSWCAVNNFRNELCPHPWRVPTSQDFKNLDIALRGSGRARNRETVNDLTWQNQIAWYTDRWGLTFGGKCNSLGILESQSVSGSYWTIEYIVSERSSRPNIYNPNPGTITGYTSLSSNLFITKDGRINPNGGDNRNNGLTLRCVR